MPPRQPPWRQRQALRVPDEEKQRRRREDNKQGPSPVDERARPQHDKSPRPARTQRIEAAYRKAGTMTPARRVPVGIQDKSGGRETSTHWGEVAEWYDRLVGDDGSDFQREVIMPGVLRMLERRKTRGEYVVLDLGCGQGVLGRFLAKEGCKVVGIDAAEQLIAKAKERNKTDKLPISYITADVTRLLDTAGHPLVNVLPLSFDAVTVVLAIQNITPLSAVWQACYRLLKPNGKVVVVMMHPCFRVPQHADWHYDPSAKLQSRLISRYMNSIDVKIKVHPSHIAQGQKSPVTTHFHRPLQAYINTLGNAGLYVDHMEEWTSPKIDEPGPHKPAKDTARKEIPLFMAIRARKV